MARKYSLRTIKRRFNDFVEHTQPIPEERKTEEDAIYQSLLSLISSFGKHNSNRQLSECPSYACCEIHTEASQLASKLAIISTENDHVCEICGWRKSAMKRLNGISKFSFWRSTRSDGRRVKDYFAISILVSVKSVNI